MGRRSVVAAIHFFKKRRTIEIVKDQLEGYKAVFALWPWKAVAGARIPLIDMKVGNWGNAPRVKTY